MDNEKLEFIKGIIEIQGYTKGFKRNSQFRYDIVEDPEIHIILGAKIPIYLPIEYKYKVELVSFYISIVIKSREGWVDKMFIHNIRYLSDALKKMVLGLEPYRHEFNIEQNFPKIKSQLDKYFPENLISQENLFNIAVRENYRAKTDKIALEALNEILSQDILDIYRDWHLRPSGAYPPELSRGVPKGKENSIVVFKNENPDEYLLEEPGSITYWRDANYKNVWIRTSMETITPFILYNAFASTQYRLNYLIYNWILYCRALIKPVMKILDNNKFKDRELRSFSEKKLIEDVFLERPVDGIFLPKLVFENILSKTKGTELVKRSEILFRNSPMTINETETTNKFIEAEYLMKLNQFRRAGEILEECLKVLKRANHPKGEIKILFKLFEIQTTLHNYKNSILMLNQALKIAKREILPIQMIIQIHLYFIQVYSQLGLPKKAENHFIISIKFVESLPKATLTDKLFMDIHLEMLKFRIQQAKLDLAREHLKSYIKVSKKYPEYMFLYYYWRGIFHAAEGNESKKIKSYKNAIEIEDAPVEEYCKAECILGEYYLYKENKIPQAMEHLSRADNMLKALDFGKIQLKLKIELILREVFNKLNLEEKRREIAKSIKMLQSQLKKFESM